MDKVDEVLAFVETEMSSLPEDERGTWLRAWPSGHVHFAPDWCSRLDGRIDTACGKIRIFWPVADWPRAKVCPACAEAFRALAKRLLGK